MIKYLALALLLGFSFQVDAQKYKNPQAYFKKFQNENRKIRIKNLRYLKATLRGDDERKVAKYRQMVIDQIKDSKKNIERLGPYQDYDILRKEYMEGLAMYVNAYENNFGIAEELSNNRYNSYEDLKKYYEAVTQAEEEMLEGAYRIEEAEQHFAKKYYLDLIKDEELEEQYAMLDEVTLYSRDMTLSFFRIDAEVRKYIELISKGNMDSLSDVLMSMRIAIRESRTEVDMYADFDGRKALYNELDDYIEEMQEEVDEDLDELTENLQNEYLDEDDYEDTQRELKRFSKRHVYRVEKFFDTKNDLIEDYLPED